MQDEDYPTGATIIWLGAMLCVLGVLSTAFMLGRYTGKLDTLHSVEYRKARLVYEQGRVCYLCHATLEELGHDVRKTT